MVGVSRYNAGGDEADILKNKLGIKDPKELEDLETLLLTDAYEHFLQLLEGNSLELNLDLLFELHSYFLCELNVIHPFREGNGRTLRLFLDVFTIHAGYEAVDFKKIPDGEFIDACKHGMLQNYEPMEGIYLKLLCKITAKK